MVFERKVTLSPENLPIETKWRFLELEIRAGLNALESIYRGKRNPRLEAENDLVHLLAYDQPEAIQDTMRTVFNSKHFNQPTKDERIQYFRYKNLGHHKVRHYAGVNLNVIGKYDDVIPSFYPIFRYWGDLHTGISRWIEARSHLNLFGDKVIQDAGPFAADYLITDEKKKELKESGISPKPSRRILQPRRK